MPEISFCLFDLNYLFKLFPRENKELNEKLSEYENYTQQVMEENRTKLFNEFEYQSEF